MRLNFLNRVKFLMIASVLSISLGGFAQSLNEAGELFNAGAQHAKAKKYAEAIQSFESCVTMCEAVGIEADELKGNASKQLPNMYYKKAIAFYKKKDYKTAIDGLNETVKVANKYNDAKLATKSEKIIPKLYNALGNGALKEKNLEEAVANFDKALELKANYPDPYFGKGLVAKEKNDKAMVKEYMNKAIELDSKSKKQKIVAKAKKVTQKYLINSGAKAIQGQKYTAAIALINESFEYGDQNADAYYYLAVANNGKKAYDEAITQANRAMEIATEGAKSKINFEIGKAYQGKEDMPNACAAYKLVVDGPMVKDAKAAMAALKCN